MNEDTRQIQLSKVEYEGRMVWFKSLLQMPTDEEMSAWVPRYREKARQRGPRNPLLIDVERDRLRELVGYNPEIPVAPSKIGSALAL
jgi:hypothetical protein